VNIVTDKLRTLTVYFHK